MEKNYKCSLFHCPMIPGVSTSELLPPDPFSLGYLYYMLVSSMGPRYTCHFAKCYFKTVFNKYGIQKEYLGTSLAAPVVKTPCSHRRGHVFDPWWGNPTCCVAKKKKKFCNTCVKLKKEQNEEPRHLQK